MLDFKYPYVLPELPYPYDALEPYIDEETMHYHHDKHFKAYVDNLNEVLQPYPELQALPLDILLKRAETFPKNIQKKILDNAGGVFNHYLFFAGLAPADEDVHEPGGYLDEMIIENFGSIEEMQIKFSESAKSVFGSGWTYLVITPGKRLKVVNFKDQETPILINATPVILLDVWEHAYYLKYKNERANYIENAWNIIKYPNFETI